MNTKLYRLAGILMILSLVLAACAQATPVTVKETVEVPVTQQVEVTAEARENLLKSDKPVTVSIRGYSWQMTGQSGLVSSQARAWAAQYPNVTLDIQVVDDWDVVLANDIAANAAPDISYFEGGMAQSYMANGQLLDISPWYNQEELKADFLPAYWDNFMAMDGKLYGIYQDTEARGVYYRKDLVTAAGVSEPKNGWTYAEMRELAKKLTTPEVAGVCIGKEVFYELAMAIGGGFQYGTEFSYDNPAVRDLYQFYSDMIADGSAPKAQAGLTRDQCFDLFAAGKVGMVFLHSNMINSILRGGAPTALKADQISFVSLPVPKAGDEFKSVGGGFMFIVIKKDYDPLKLAYVEDLFKYVTSVNSQTEYLLNGAGITPRTSVMNNINKLVTTDTSLKTDVLAPFWPLWLEVATHNVAPQPRDPNNFVWCQGLVQGVEAIQSGKSVDEAVKAATDYFATNKK